MKKILYILTVALVMVSCGDKNEGGINPEPPEPPQKEEPTLKDLLCEEWHSTSLSIDDADIYISFDEAKKFELYQKIGEGAYRLYRGTWNVEEDILTGKYNDGESWAASYAVAIEGKSMTLTSKNDAEEISKYEQKNIPEEVKAGCEVVVKSAEKKPF